MAVLYIEVKKRVSSQLILLLLLGTSIRVKETMFFMRLAVLYTLISKVTFGQSMEPAAMS